jgi:hypothetical protein
MFCYLSVICGLLALALLALSRCGFLFYAHSSTLQQTMQLNPPSPAAATRLTDPVVWHHLIPDELQPFEDQRLVAERLECWEGWWYWHLDYYTETGFKIRYVADIQYCWNPGARLPTPPWLHFQNTVRVMAAKNRGGCRGTLIQVENSDSGHNGADNVIWRLVIVSCYLPVV